MSVPTIEAVTIDEQVTAIRINSHEFTCEDESGNVIVPKEFLNNFSLSQIPEGVFIKPVESVEGNVIHLDNDIALTPFSDGSASGIVELMLRRKFWDGDVGLSKYVSAFRQAMAETENVGETGFEDDGDYVFLHYEVIMASDYDVQDAIALVEATIHKVEERTELLLGRRIDGLLGIYDRGSFDADLNYVLRTSTGTVSVVMADIDHFKNVNDTHGHQVGDDVLRAVAKVLAGHCGVGAAAYRYGGEELIAILKDIDHDKAMKFAESVRLDVEKLRFENPALSVTLSLGVATFPVDGATLKELIGRADAALYDAKHSGRNCAKSSQHKAADAAGRDLLIRVHVMLNKMKSGRRQITVIQPGITTGAVMTYRDDADVRNLLKSFTLADGAIEANLTTLSEIGPMELLKVATIEISHDLLQSLGFKGV